MFTSTAFSSTPADAEFTHRSAEPIAAAPGHGPAPTSNTAQPAFPLSMAAPGASVRVAALRGSGMDRRMTEMGLNVGAEIRVVLHQGAGLVVQRGESRYALAAGLAHRVLVVPV